MRQLKRISNPTIELAFNSLPWIPDNLKESLSAIVAFLLDSIKSDISGIGLYGSWQKGNANLYSDVDIVVFLDHEVAWFDAEIGVVNRSDGHKDRLHWHAIEIKAAEYRLDARDYSIAIVTLSMLKYYATRGPIHLQNWAHALRNCHLLWKR
jgi:hypothetical protein